MTRTPKDHTGPVPAQVGASFISAGGSRKSGAASGFWSARLQCSTLSRGFRQLSVVERSCSHQPINGLPSTCGPRTRAPGTNYVTGHPSYTGTLRRHSRSSRSSIFAILLSAFLRLRVLLSTEAGLGSRTRMIRLQLLGLQLSAPCLAAGPRSPCWRLRRDARRPPR